MLHTPGSKRGGERGQVRVTVLDGNRSNINLLIGFTERGIY